ncbi:hypothetical protein [Tellurirhabdus rosea]|uniref:hypothetical protein n=1 Tax=Tellurirhabdus rosea TaxID=2674997 RepID=UPI00225A7162|nr:hypothetical protein [Tellurirhabdus rosea]
MKSKLERFVRDNREDFDTFEPRADLWDSIAQELGHQPERRWAGSVWVNNTFGNRRRMWQIAASVSVIVGLAGGFLYFNNQYGVTRQPDVVAAAPAHAREFVQYTRLIDEKRAELKTLTASNPVLYQEFSTELNQLEASYKNLRKELPENPNQEVLIQAMVQNLQLQIDLLNQQLMIIQRIKQQNNEPKTDQLI